MSNRIISTYEEPRNQEGPYWTIEAERSSSGNPTVLVTIKHAPFTDGDYETKEMTIIIEDAYEFFGPIVDWLAGRREQE